MNLSFQPITALDKDLSPDCADAIVRLLRAAIRAVDPGEAVAKALVLDGSTLRVGVQEYNLDTFEHVYLVGAGKASAAMAAAIEEKLGQRISGGWVNVKDGYGAPTRKVTIHEASHPIPDERGLVGSRAILDIVRKAGPRDLIIAVISGGGSALMPLPVDGVALEDVQTLTNTLLRCGATIQEINTIRKHLSQMQGGRLAQVAAPAELLALIISDVIGSPLEVIASGPTCPDPSTYDEAWAILDRYGLTKEAPTAIVDHLKSGRLGKTSDTPKQDSAVFRHTHSVVIASNELAAQAVVQEARALEMNAVLLSTFIEGEAREVAKLLAAVAREIDHSGQPVARPACVVVGGETTVTVRGSGLGGRNQELALSAVPRLAGISNVAIISFGTDGTDGPTDAAGAVVTGNTSARAVEQGLDVAAYLAENNAYRFFEALGDLIITGPTGTNVNDLMLVCAF